MGIMPAAFLGHGSPVNTLEDNRYTRAWKAFGTVAPAPRAGILIIGSGNVVHALGRIDPAQRDTGFDWAMRFDEAAREIMTTRPADVLSLQHHPDFERAVPTPDHFIPLVYLAGLAQHGGSVAKILVDGYALGSLSMTSYTLDCECPSADRGDEPSADPLPDRSVPPDQTNL